MFIVSGVAFVIVISVVGLSGSLYPSGAFVSVISYVPDFKVDSIFPCASVIYIFLFAYCK